MADNNRALLNFKHGLQVNLTANSPEIAPGTVYITRDERAMYVDLPPYMNGDQQVEAAKRIRIGDMQNFETITAMQQAINDDKSILHTSSLFFVEKDSSGNNINALFKWTGDKSKGHQGFVQLNEISDITANLNELTGKVSTLESDVSGLKTKVESLESAVGTLNGNENTSGSVAHSIKTVKEALEGQIALKADQSALSELSGTVASNKSSIDTKIEGLESRIGTNEGNITAIQGTITTLTGSGDGSISKQISDAVAVETQARENKDTEHTNAISELAEDLSELAKDLSDEITARQGVAKDLADNYLKSSVIESNYLKQTDAASTYLSKNDAASTYLSKADAASTYATQSALSNEVTARQNVAKDLADNYLKKTVIESTYATKNELETAKTNISTTYATKEELNTAKSDLLGNADSVQGGNTISGLQKSISSINTEINGLDGRLDTIELFFESAEKGDKVIDTLAEIQTYIDEHAGDASDMLASINSKASQEELNSLSGTVSDNKTELEGKITDSLSEAKGYTDTALTWVQFN